MSGVRIDAWLWAVRLYKTRSAATAAVRAGHVRIDGEPVKAATPVVVGNRVRVRQDGRERILEVTGLIAKRVGAPVARQQYVDRERGAGRPTKRDRRQLDALRGRDRR